MAADPGARLDRALGALAGVALGDALGMPAETLSRAEIRSRWGRIDGFVDRPSDHPFSAGLRAGTVTDDTEQTLLLARRLLASPGRFDAAAWARDLVAWERGMRDRGRDDLLGPSTRRAVAAFLAGADLASTGRHGDTNGAAMRIAPVGIATPPAPLDTLLEAVEETCRITHNTDSAIAAAAAVAAAVSAGIEGDDWRAATGRALAAAEAGGDRGHPTAGPGIGNRIRRAVELARTASGARGLDRIAGEVGTGVAAVESVPAAFAVLEIAGGDPWRTGLAAANLGGDADTIGAIAAGIAGACRGCSALPEGTLSILRAENGLELEATAHGLLALRDRRVGTGG